jgi:hypothetical protein
VATNLYLQGKNRLYTRQAPSKVPFFILTGGSIFFVFTLAMSSSEDGRNVVVFSILTLVGVLGLFSAQETECIVNLESKTISIKRAGLFNSSIGHIDQIFDLAHLSHIQMVRRVYRSGKDAFAIQLIFHDMQQMLLTDETLNFTDCQRYANQIQKFLGSHVPIRAVTHHYSLSNN